MSAQAPTPALERNADAAQTAPPPAQPKRRLTIQQETILREFTSTYQIDPSQIGFEGENEQAIFDFDALSILALKLTDFKDITIEKGDLDYINGVATSECRITLQDGRTRQMFAACSVGELLHDGGEVKEMSTALAVSRARAMRTAFRAVGFDPVREHEKRKHDGQTLELTLNEARNNELAQIHALGEESGLIDLARKDKTRYYGMMNIMFPGLTSARDMTDQQRAKWIAILRGIVNSRERTSGTSRGLDHHS
jgi:hypothetical protein